LLRVDYITGGSKPDDPKPSSLSTAPLHACLATATPPELTPETRAHSGNSSAATNPSAFALAADVAPGEILTIGRKNSHVTLDDKCVSRGHASIRLVSKTYGNNGGSDDGNEYKSTTISLQLPEDSNGRIMMQFAAPSTPEERRLCDSSVNGVIAVLVDKGSKFGTFVSVDEDLVREFQQQHSKDSDSHDNDDADETADETDAGEGENNALAAQCAELSEKQARAVKLLSGWGNFDYGSRTTSFFGWRSNNLSLCWVFRMKSSQGQAATCLHRILLHLPTLLYCSDHKDQACGCLFYPCNSHSPEFRLMSNHH